MEVQAKTSAHSMQRCEMKKHFQPLWGFLGVGVETGLVFLSAPSSSVFFLLSYFFPIIYPPIPFSTSTHFSTPHNHHTVVHVAPSSSEFLFSCKKFNLKMILPHYCTVSFSTKWSTPHLLYFIKYHQTCASEWVTFKAWNYGGNSFLKTKY